MGYQRLQKADIADTPFIRRKVKECGDVITVTELSRMPNTQATIIKLSGSEYLDVASGEIREYEKHAETRIESEQSARRTMAHIRDLVNCNVTRWNSLYCHWITFTYRDRTVKGVEGAARVSHDWDCFWKRFRRYCGRKGYKKPEYITVMEPHGDGVYHLHVILIWAFKRPFIPNETMAQLWTQGFTKTQKLPHTNMGAYLSAYLADIEVDEYNGTIPYGYKVEEKTVGGQKKRFIKGARLKFYPSGVNIIRHSRGIAYPNEYDITVDEMNAMQGDMMPSYEYHARITDEETGFELIMTRRIYVRNADSPPLARAA